VFVALGIQYAMGMRSIISLSVAGLAVKYFSMLSYKGTIFKGGKKLFYIQNILFLFSLQLLSDTFLIQRRIQQDITKICIVLYVKCPSFLSNFEESLIFSTDFRKILLFQIL
jgi:hypothetical protein